MVTTGIIKEVNGETVSVEMFDAVSSMDKPSCASGGCARCKAPNQGRIISAVNPKGFFVESGTLIEMELPTVKALMAGFRVLMIPLLLFIGGFAAIGTLNEATEGIQIVGGFTGLIAGFLLNILLSKKNRVKEMPEI